MLKELRIFNIILIETAEMTFQEGMNVITGETGSGKSAIMHALSYITGARADTGVIRKGCDKGAIEAAFEIDTLSHLKQMLEKAGIEQEPGAELIIRREISSNGKSRAFINNQFVQISLLRSVGEQLINIVSQHANQHLLSIDHHRHIVDLFGDLEQEVAIFSEAWARENSLHRQINELTSSEAQRLREIEVCLRELEELKEAALKEGEDEEIFAEYSLLANSEELAQKTEALVQTMTGDKQSIIQILNRNKTIFEELVRIDPALSDAAKSFYNAQIELQEIAYTLTAYQSRIEYNPTRTRALNDRLSLITSLKRKYGTTIPEIQSYQSNAAEKLKQLENTDARIEELKEELQQLSNKNHQLSTQLTEHRKQTAKKFEKSIVKQLRSLNMPKVEFQVEITPQKRSRTGDDQIEFFLIPNVGEHQIPLKDCASGGELSRMLLALHTVLAGKEQTPTLIFDEIDGNIGGETAVIVGEKLEEIGNKHQVICITHFPQVAKQAVLHLQISKSEKGGRTATRIQTLDPAARQRELARMVGGDLSLMARM